MQNTTRIRCSALIAVIGVMGCATIGGLKDEPLTEGTSRPFAAEFEELVKVVPEVFDSLGLELTESYPVNDEAWMFLGEKPASLFSYGAVLRVVVERLGEHQTAVRIVSKRRVGTAFGNKGDYSKDIFEAVANHLKLEP